VLKLIYIEKVKNMWSIIGFSQKNKAEKAVVFFNDLFFVLRSRGIDEILLIRDSDLVV
jgi:hypothetical protein